MERWKVMVFSSGQMVDLMMDNMLMIRKKARVFSLGQMEGSMTENGRMVNSMVKAFIAKIMGRRYTAYGKKERR